MGRFWPRMGRPPKPALIPPRPGRWRHQTWKCRECRVAINAITGPSAVEIPPICCSVFMSRIEDVPPPPRPPPSKDTTDGRLPSPPAGPPNLLVSKSGRIRAKRPPAPPLNLEMIDGLIRYWREFADRTPINEATLIAAAYLDAYQTIRINHGLGRLEA